MATKAPPDTISAGLTTGALTSDSYASAGPFDVLVEGTFVGVVHVQSSKDNDATWQDLAVLAAPGRITVKPIGTPLVRATMSGSYTSGTANVYMGRLGAEAAAAVQLVDTVAGRPVTYGFTPTQITTSASTPVKNGPGMIGSCKCNKSGSGDTVTVYDALSATGTPIATITGATVGMVFCEGYIFNVGCYVVTSGGTPGNYTFAVA
ncbi:hypothetical protein [Reyranella sp.]|uniref:hypothetical protein n=1 Tax=Reyranella sp. TaxID=1929291 RepID=UPI003D137654